MADIERIRISREVLERWVDQVFFEDTVVDCFVRLTMAHQQKQHEYYMCQIVSSKRRSPIDRSHERASRRGPV